MICGAYTHLEVGDNLTPPVSGLCCLAVTTLLTACDSDPTGVPSPPFDEIFALAETVELAEAPSDSIAQIGRFQERRSGGFLISDALLPRLRAYSDDGALDAAFGRFGDGPWEFREISGFSGRIAASSWRNA